MRVSVVVPTFRRPELLARCLAALSRQTLERSEYEVLVADDGADEPTRSLVQSLAGGTMRVRYVAVSGNHGPAAARNRGWQAAQGEIIAFTDDDCLPDSGWLAEGLAPFADPAVVAVTGQVVVPLPPWPTDYERDAAGLETAEFVTANCFCRRAALVEIGGFDERFTSAWREDSDLHFRLLDRGGGIAKVERAVVVHPVRPAPWGISLRQQRKCLFDALLFRKHPQHFRQRIWPTCPWDYYIIVAAVAAVLMGVATGRWTIAAAALVVWIFFTARFVYRRLLGTSREASHVAEMAATSLAIPFLSVFWRLYGAWRFRVLFW